MSTPLARLLRSLSAGFSNQQQAFENPPLYAHILVKFRPLPRPGERCPVDDPALEPILEPRPVGDALYLQGLLEGLAAIEQQGWRRLQALGAPPIRRVISLGGGARNPQWRLIRQRLLGLPVLNRPRCTAAQGMARLALSACPPP
ncbi:MAG: CpcT/CpeT family chromophore lyase [Vulcanococcus sp.]